MARKKTIVTTEEVETPEETPIDYKKDIENKSFLEVALDTPDEPTEEVPAETPREEETETVEFDPEAFKKETAEQVKNDILESLKGDTKEETKENVDHYQEFQKEFFEKNNRQPTWFEVAKDMEEQAVQRLRDEQSQQVKAAEEEKVKQTEALTKQNEEVNKYVKDTLDELYTNEKLPKIANKDDTDDYGLKVQNQLLAKVVEVNSQRLKDSMPPKTIKEIFYEDFEIPSKEVPGANAPVNMGRGGYTPDDNQQIDYRKDIQGKSFRQLLTDTFKRG